MKTKLCIILFLFGIFVFNQAALSATVESSLGDFVWEDLNGNGIQDDGSFGIPGVTVELHTNASATNMIDSLTTNSVGNYYFYGLGNDNYDTYWLKFILPTGYYFTAQNAGADPTEDSDADPFTGIAGGSLGIPLGEFDYDYSWDAGLRAVPIPAAAYILGAGLLGIAGLRRKLKK